MSAPAGPVAPDPGSEPDASSVDTVAPVAPVKQSERPHPLTPFVRGWVVLVALVLGFGRQLVETVNDPDGFRWSELGWAAPIVGGLAVLSGVAGLVSWAFTRFVIDDDELRIETGALYKNSKKVSFERVQSVDIVQPLAARMFGLAELRIEVGAGDSAVRLRYLSRGKATRLRDYLIARAHGDRTATTRQQPGAEMPNTSAFTDLGRVDHPIVRVAPSLLVAGFLLSTDFLVTVAFTIIGFVITGVLGVTLFALPGLLPLAFGLLGMVSRRVIAQFNYTLAQTTRGLRITRGLTNLTSQSVPVDRIQGVRISQPIFWRRFGWQRIDIDVLGFGSGGDGDDSNEVTSILLPVATRAQCDLALAQVLPGVDLDAITLHPSPRRSRRFRPFDWWTLRFGFDDRVIISGHGVLTAVRDIVPHAKTQSVSIEQGPLQRRATLADVQVHTPKGPVNLVAKHLEPAVARELALSQLDRARRARARGLLVADAQVSDEAVLDHFDRRGTAPLGSGGEATVYPLDEGRVLRVYKPGHASQATIPHQLQALYRGWSQLSAPFEVPQVDQVGVVAGRTFTIDRRMSGRNMTEWLPTVDMEQRQATLISYLDTAMQLRRLPLPRPGFGRLLGDDPRVFPSLGALLDDQLRGAWTALAERFEADLPDAGATLAKLRADLGELDTLVRVPELVHGDYFPGNVFVSRTGDDQVVVSGVGDFSPHTLAADPIMDVAGAIFLMQLEPYADARADSDWLKGIALERLGAPMQRWLEFYGRFYAVYFATDPAVYPWSLEILSADHPDPSAT